MDKFKAILKALLFGAIMLLFLVGSALIAKALKLSQNRTYIFQGGMVLLSVIIPVFYIGHKNYSAAGVGLNKPTGKIMKHLLFYLPLLSVCALVIAFNKNVGVKSLIVQGFFYGSVAIAAEIYFRGIIQTELRGKFNVLVGLIFVAILYAACNLYYFNRITSIKHVLVLSVFSFAVAGILGIIIESKGNIIFTIIFNAIYLVLTINYTSGKKLVLSQGICLGILFIYGLFLLITYFKANKPEKVEEETDTKELENQGFDENGNMEL
jgi:membrane protease YdiL (CAAX protease family)